MDRMGGLHGTGMEGNGSMEAHGWEGFMEGNGRADAGRWLRHVISSAEGGHAASVACSGGVQRPQAPAAAAFAPPPRVTRLVKATPSLASPCSSIHAPWFGRASTPWEGGGGGTGGGGEAPHQRSAGTHTHHAHTHTPCTHTHTMYAQRGSHRACRAAGRCTRPRSQGTALPALPARLTPMSTAVIDSGH